jgi:hypothetical protein
VGETGGNHLTIENRTGEVREELEEDVLLLGGQLVPSGLLATGLDIVCLEALLHVGGKPLVGGLEAIARGALGATRPPILLGNVVVAANGRGATAVAVLRDVADEIAVLALVVIVVSNGLLRERVVTNLLFSAAILELVERRHGLGGNVYSFSDAALRIEGGERGEEGLSRNHHC